MKNHILGTILLSIITGVAGNFVYDAVKPNNKIESGPDSVQHLPTEFAPVQRKDQGIFIKNEPKQ